MILTAKTQIERRYTVGEVEVRQYNGDKYRIEGHAAVFGKRSADLGGFHETVAPGAFSKTIQEADVRGLWNHDPNYVLGRSAAQTLKLSVDSTGLLYQIDPPDTTWARDLLVSMERGDVSNSSFAFRTIKDDWGLDDEEYPHRSLLEVGLVDVSVVTYPAYPDADSGVGRSAALASIAMRSGRDIEELTPDALKALLTGEPEETRSEPEPIATDTTPVEVWAKRARLWAALEKGTYHPE